MKLAFGVACAAVVWVGVVVGCSEDDAKSSGSSGSGGDSSSSGPAGVGGGITPPPPSCTPASDGGSTDVAVPELIASLSDRWHESWLASPVVADLDEDGTPEIISSRHGLVLGWHIDGSVVFRQQVDGRCWASPVVADLRSDLPGLEIAQASEDKIYAWSADGSALPGFPYIWQNELRSLAAGDIDGDGELELISVTTNYLDQNNQRDIVIAVNADGSTVAGFPPNTSGAAGCDAACFVFNGYDQNVAIGDVDGDGTSDTTPPQAPPATPPHRGDGFGFDCAPIFDGKTKFMGVRGLHDFAEAQQGWAPDEATALQAHHTNTAPAIADVDGDGVGELVYLASVQNAAQDNREQGVALWVMENDGTRPDAWLLPLHFPDYLSGLWDYGNNIVAITNQVSVVDLDPAADGPEMVFAGFDGRIHAVDSQANVLWSAEYTQSAEIMTGGVLVADLSGDGAPEIIFATYSTQQDVSELFILDGGANLQHRIALPGRGAMPVPTLGDADGDGTLDIVVSLKDAGPNDGPQVLVYRVASASDNCMLWPTGRGNYLRDGYLPPGG